MAFRNMVIVFLNVMIVKTSSQCNVTIDNSQQQEIASALSKETTDAVYIRPEWCDYLDNSYWFNPKGCDRICATWVITSSSKGELTLSFSPVFKSLSLGMLSFGVKDIIIRINEKSCTDEEVFSEINMNLYKTFIQNNKTVSKRLCFAECQFDFWTRAISNNYQCCEYLDGSLQCTTQSTSATLTIMNVLVFLLFIRHVGLPYFNFFQYRKYYRLIVHGVKLPDQYFIRHPQNTEKFTIVHLTTKMLLAEQYIDDVLQSFLRNDTRCCIFRSNYVLRFLLFFIDSFPIWFFVYIYALFISYRGYYEISYIPTIVHIIILFVFHCCRFILIYMADTTLEYGEPFSKRVLRMSLYLCKHSPCIGILLFPAYYPLLCVWFMVLFMYYKSQLLHVFVQYFFMLCVERKEDSDGIRKKLAVKFLFSVITIAFASLISIWNILMIVYFVSYCMLGIFINTYEIVRYMYIPVIIILFLHTKIASIFEEYKCFYLEVLKYLPTEEARQGDLEKYVIKRQKGDAIRMSAKFFNEVCKMELNECPGSLLKKIAETVVGAALVGIMSAVIFMILNFLRLNSEEATDMSYWINIGTVTFTVSIWIIQRLFGLSSKDYSIPEDMVPIFIESLGRTLLSFIHNEKNIDTTVSDSESGVV